MTRIFAATTILMCLVFSISCPAQSQSNSATDRGCFPWQELRNGLCVAKPANTPPPPLPTPAVAPPAVTPPAPPVPPPVTAGTCLDGGFRNSAGQCVCPTGTHADSGSGRCLADIAVRPPAPITCDGGTPSNGACVCPSDFKLVPTEDDTERGICVRTDAENCQGGELTVSGRCMCNGQVTMSGETYLLEFSNGKCLPMNCPVEAMKDGKCGTTASAEPTTAPEDQGRPAQRRHRETRDHSEEEGHRRHCGRGLVMTRVGCVPAERRLNDIYHQYYRNYQFPGIAPPN